MDKDLLINEVLSNIEERGEAIVKLPPEEILSALGYLRSAGFDANTTPDREILVKLRTKKESKSVGRPKTVQDNLAEVYPNLCASIENEVEYVEEFQTSPDAKVAADMLRKHYGTLLLIRIKQVGRVVKTVYRTNLPLQLPADYPKDTLLGWAKALTKRVGPTGALIAYNRHEGEYSREKLSMAKFEKMMEEYEYGEA